MVNVFSCQFSARMEMASNVKKSGQLYSRVQCYVHSGYLSTKIQK